MPQREQIFIQNGYYHIYNRGHNKQAIFLNAKDYQRYLKRLKEYLEKHPISLLAYCLMPNHIHLILRQDSEEPTERFIHRLHTSYTMYFNIKYKRVGAVFQGRFKAKLIDSDEYLLHVSRYVHQNPLEIIFVQGRALKLDKYPWSSYPEYVGKTSHPLCKTNIILDCLFQGLPNKQKNKYQAFVEEGMDNIDQSLFEDLSNGKLPTLMLKAGP